MKLLSSYVQNLPSLRAAHAKRRLFLTVYPLIVGILGESFLLLRTGRISGVTLILCIVLSAVLWFVFPMMIRSSAFKFSTRLYANPKFDWIFGEKIIETTDDGIDYSSESASGKNKWETISNCGFIEDAFVLIVGPTSGFVIKQDQVIEGDFSAFASEVMRRTQSG